MRNTVWRYVVGLWACCFVSYGQQAVGLPAVAPAAVTAGVPTTVRVSALISRFGTAAVIPASVNLLRTDASGNALAVAGVLNDSGKDGDS